MSGYMEQCACGGYTDHAPCPRCAEKLIEGLRADLAACQRERDELRELVRRWYKRCKSEGYCNLCSYEFRLCRDTRKALGVE